METTTISSIFKFEGKQVRLQGWLYNARFSKKLHFLQIRDGSGIIQGIVSESDVSPEIFSLSASLNQEDAIITDGVVRKDSRSPLGFELGVDNIQVVSRSEPYPISPKEHGVAFLMDQRHLWLRSRRQHIIMKIRHTIIKAVRDYFDDNGFTLIDAPIFTPSACEGTTTLFETNYFDDKAYLTQSGQLYMEAGAMAHGKVYCFGPVFRAEKSKTRRHLTEFWMVEPEVAYMELDQDMDLAEDFLVFIVERVLNKHEKDLKEIERNLDPLNKIKKPFYRISYTEAIKKLHELGLAVEWGGDFGAEDETVLTQAFDRPIIVHRFPSQIKAFYMKADPKDPKVALCMDVLAPEGYGEIIGGGQREDNGQTLLAKIEEHKLPLDAFQWYLDLRRYGSVPHAGFGLGIERTVAWICGLHHVRETIPFPRMLERIVP